MRGYPRPVVRDGKAFVGKTPISVRNIRLDEYVASGANAFVFAGEDLQLDRRVAVKVWAPRRDGRVRRRNSDRTDQVLGEVRKIARFKDRHIAAIYNIDRLPGSGWFYVVMEFVDGEVLKNIRQDLDYQMRTFIWSHVFMALDAAERQGAFHGDLHDGNVIVTSFLGDVTLIDFGTSALSGRGDSMRRHARKVNEFAQQLLPELGSYLRPFNVETLVTPEYATIAVNQWVESALELQKIDNDLPVLSGQDLDRRLTTLASETSSTHLNIYEPVTEWLIGKGVPSENVNVYLSASKENLMRAWEARKSTFRARLIPATKSWITNEWLEANS